MEPAVTREDLGRWERQVLQAGSTFRPDLSVFYRGGGRRVVVKDCACMHPVLRFLMGRRSAQRECSVYRRLDGVEGIPRFLGAIDIDAFALEYVEGEPLGRGLEPGLLPRALADLGRVINAMHDRHVVHLDLKQKRNVLIRPDGSVVVLDFQSAFYLGGGPVRRLLFSFLKRRDLAGLIKFKAKYLPTLLTPDEEKIYRRERIMSRLWPFTFLTRILRKVFKNENCSD